MNMYSLMCSVSSVMATELKSEFKNREWKKKICKDFVFFLVTCELISTTASLEAVVHGNSNIWLAFTVTENVVSGKSAGFGLTGLGFIPAVATTVLYPPSGNFGTYASFLSSLNLSFLICEIRIPPNL